MVCAKLRRAAGTLDEACEPKEASEDENNYYEQEET
jgi:hypothetical protein